MAGRSVVYEAELTIMRLGPDILKSVLAAVRQTSALELDCDECSEELGRFAELRLAGLDAAQALPLVEQHLTMCGDCREEYQVLLDVLRGMTSRRSWWRITR